MLVRHARSLVLLLALACANGTIDDAGEPVAVSEVPADTAPRQFTAVPLPDDFPDEFPIPPGAVPVGGSVERKATGTLASVELLDRTDARATVAWFRDALTDLGWVVTESRIDSTTAALQAARGESYVQLAVRPAPAGPADHDPTDSWLYIEAEIWTVSP